MDVMAYIAIGVAIVVGLLAGIIISPGLRGRLVDTAAPAESDSAGTDCLPESDRGDEEVVKNMQRQIDDAAEELEDAESTIKKLKRHLADVMVENDRLKKDLAALPEPADPAAYDTPGDKELVKDSLAFVQDVLTAKPVNTENLTKQDKKINALYDFVYSDLQELYKRHFRPNEKSGYVFGQGLSQWKAMKRKSWIEGKKTIAFIGEFSAGKTTIVNRILSQDRPDTVPLPVSAKPATAIPTYIAAGESTTYQFCSHDGSLKEIGEDTFKMVSKEMIANIAGISELIHYFVMTYQNPYLAGMSILDTPGFSSAAKEDAARTMEVINECDALFWVVDVNAGTVNRSSLEVIKANMARPLYVIINQTDTKAPSEVDAVARLVKKAFEDEGIEVQGYLRFSYTTPLDGLMEIITSVKSSSPAEQYLSLLADDFLPSLIAECEEGNRAIAGEMDSSDRKCDAQWNAIQKLCQAIQNDSSDAAAIPHWEKHFLRKARYELNKQEGARLVDLLDKVANKHTSHLTEEINRYGELMQENQRIYEKKSGGENTLQQLRECQIKLNRLIADLNR